MSHPFGKPYTKLNQLDWWGTLWCGATIIYTGCQEWDSRDWYEFIEVQDG